MVARRAGSEQPHKEGRPSVYSTERFAAGGNAGQRA